MLFIVLLQTEKHPKEAERSVINSPDINLIALLSLLLHPDSSNLIDDVVWYDFNSSFIDCLP